VKGSVPILEGILNFGKKHLGRIGFGKEIVILERNMRQLRIYQETYDLGKKHEAG
jgi:hypothetical protein